MIMAHSKNFRDAYRAVLALFVAAVFCTSLSGCEPKRPVVGVSCGWNKGRVSLSDAYLIAVRAAGGVPVVLPPVMTEEDAAAALSSVDALILSGGEDVDPARYGEEVLFDNVEVNSARDTSDFLLAAEALRRGLPVLGICRGEQLLNVVLGGTLYQDLPSQVGEDHRQSEPDGVPTHMIYIEAGSRLQEILGADSLMVNTFHHQAVKDPAPGIRVVARAPDGVIEAWEWNGRQSAGSGTGPAGLSSRSTLICVQFHPELLYARGGNQAVLPLFQDLISRAR